MLASYTGAFAGVMLVLYEGHVVIVLGERATYTSVFHHKCGLTMLAMLAWAGFETVMFCAALLRERREEQAYLQRIRKPPTGGRAASAPASSARPTYPRRPNGPAPASPYAQAAQASVL